jgi:hypothetical protein
MRNSNNCIKCGKPTTFQVCKECSKPPVKVAACPFFSHRDPNGVINCRRGGALGIAEPIYLKVAVDKHFNDYCCGHYTDCQNRLELLEVNS